MQRIEFLASSLKNLDFLILIRYHVFVEFLDKDGYMDKRWVSEVIPDKNNTIGEKDRPKLTIPEQIAYMRDKKGISFELIDETEAEIFLRESNYYFKLKAFEKNYSKYASGDNKGKYYKLEFAYLKELSTIDMHLREIIRSMSLDIEHFLKVRLLNDISEDENEDGYSIVEEFLQRQPHVSRSIQDKAENSYCEGLIKKYSYKFSVWTIVEVLSFGDFLNLCDLYYSKKSNPTINVGNFRIVKFLRNAASHNNCLINNLADNAVTGFKQNREANAFVATIDGISANVRSKKMGNRFVHDFVVMLYCFDGIVSSEKVKKHQMEKLKNLVDNRIPLHKDYFSDNMLLWSNYEFVKKIVDKFAERCI